MGRPRTRAELAIDCAAGILFAAFVAVLFLGFEDPGFPYATVAPFPLVGSLAVLFWGNLHMHRVARSPPDGQSGTER